MPKHDYIRLKARNKLSFKRAIRLLKIFLCLNVTVKTKLTVF